MIDLRSPRPLRPIRAEDGRGKGVSRASDRRMKRLKIHLQQTTEFARKIDGYAGMNCPLFVKETLGTGKREDPFVPDVGVDVEAAGAIKSKAHELLGPDVVAR